MVAVMRLCRRPQTLLIFRRRQSAFCHDKVFRLIALHRPNLIRDNLDAFIRYIHASLHHERTVFRQDIRRFVELAGEHHRLNIPRVILNGQIRHRIAFFRRRPFHLRRQPRNPNELPVFRFAVENP